MKKAKDKTQAKAAKPKPVKKPKKKKSKKRGHTTKVSPKVKKGLKKVSRARRTATGRRTKYYRPYKPRVKQTIRGTKRKRNNYIYFRSCLSRWLTIEGPGYDWHLHGLSFSKVSSILWYSQPADLRISKIDIICSNLDQVWAENFKDPREPEKTGRENDIIGLKRGFLHRRWWKFRDELRIDLISSGFYKPGDVIIIDGNVGTEAGRNFEFAKFHKLFWDRVVSNTHEGEAEADEFYDELKEKFASDNKIKINDKRVHAYTDVALKKIIPHEIDDPDNPGQKKTILIIVYWVMSEQDADMHMTIGEYSAPESTDKTDAEYIAIATSTKGTEQLPPKTPLAPETPAQPDKVFNEALIEKERQKGLTERAKLEIESAERVKLAKIASIEKMFAAGKITFDQYMSAIEKI